MRTGRGLPGNRLSWLQVGPLALLLFAMVLAPLVLMVVVSFMDYGYAQVLPVFTLDNYHDLLTGQTLRLYGRNVGSGSIGPADWLELLRLIHHAAAEHPDLAGVVVTHGTASLEETAYFLNVALKVPVAVAVVGAMRPSTALGADGGLNLLNGVRVVASPEASGMGVMVVLNDEINASREVTKTSTFRVQTFVSRDFGMLGHADPDEVVFYRTPMRRRAPDTEFDVAGMAALPRVDIIAAYAGADGLLVDAAVAAGARRLVSAGLPPGFAAAGQRAALEQAVRAGVVVVQSSRAGSGRVIDTKMSLRESGFIGGDNLTPQKARILLMLALTVTTEPENLRRVFRTY